MSLPVRPVMRFTLFAKRRDDLTAEQFYEYWEKVHAPLTAPWLVKHKVLAYSQVAESKTQHQLVLQSHVMQIHTPRSSDKPSTDGALPLPFVCDGIAEFDVDDIPTFSKAFSDPYYINVIKADEVNFLDTKAKLIRSSGVLRKVVDGGKAAEGTEGSFKKAKEDMRRFREEWDAREMQAAEEGRGEK